MTVQSRKGAWRRSATTRRAVLDAAREMFLSRGYEATSIEDIVARSGVSVGSVYHQFGGKREILLALSEEVFARHADVSACAIRQAAESGETDPLRLYLAGARAFLMDTWLQRDIDRVSLLDDAPAGTEGLRRENHDKFVRGARNLRIGDPPLPDSTAQAMTAVLKAAAAQLMDVKDDATAHAVINYFTGLIERWETADRPTLPG